MAITYKDKNPKRVKRPGAIRSTNNLGSSTPKGGNPSFKAGLRDTMGGIKKNFARGGSFLTKPVPVGKATRALAKNIVGPAGTALYIGGNAVAAASDEQQRSNEQKASRGGAPVSYAASLGDRLTGDVSSHVGNVIAENVTRGQDRALKLRNAQGFVDTAKAGWDAASGLYEDAALVLPRALSRFGTPTGQEPDLRVKREQEAAASAEIDKRNQERLRGEGTDTQGMLNQTAQNRLRPNKNPADPRVYKQKPIEYFDENGNRTDRDGNPLGGNATETPKPPATGVLRKDSFQTVQNGVRERVNAQRVKDGLPPLQPNQAPGGTTFADGEVVGAPDTPVSNRNVVAQSQSVPGQSVPGQPSRLRTVGVPNPNGVANTITGDLSKIAEQIRGPGSTAGENKGGTLSNLRMQTPAQMESQYRSLRGLNTAKRAAQLGIPEEAVPFIEAGGRVSDVRRALRANLTTDLGPREDTLTEKDKADLKLRTAGHNLNVVKEMNAAGRQQGQDARSKIDWQQKQTEKTFLDVDEEFRGAKIQKFNEAFNGHDFENPEQFQKARQLQDVMEQARVAAEESTGYFSSGGFWEFLDKAFGLNDPKVGTLSNKEAVSTLKSLAGDGNEKVFGEFLNDSKTGFTPRTMKLLRLMRRNQAAGLHPQDY